MSTRQMVSFVILIIVAAAVGFVIGMMLGGPIGVAILGYTTPRQLLTVSLMIGMLMAVAFGSFVYYMGEFFDVKQVPTASWRRENQELLKQLKEEPEDARLHVELARSLRPGYHVYDWNRKITSRAKKAEAEYKKAIALQPNLPDPHIELGMLYFAWRRPEARFEDARSEFMKALKIDPQNFEAHRCLALVLMREGRHAEAESHYRTTLKIRPDAQIVSWELGFWLEKMGEVEKASKEFKKIFPEYDPNLHKVDKSHFIMHGPTRRVIEMGFVLVDKKTRRRIKTSKPIEYFNWLD